MLGVPTLLVSCDVDKILKKAQFMDDNISQHTQWPASKLQSQVRINMKNK